MQTSGWGRIGMVLLLTATASWANGYKILGVKSARATAMGEAFIAQANDPSALAFNPAGLSVVTGNQFNVQTALCTAYARHVAPNGESTHNESRWQAVPSIFLTSDFGLKDVGFGLGATLPNGLSSEWGEQSFARYVSTYSSLLVADLSPAVGFKVTKRFSVGAGLDYYYSQAQLEHMLDMGAPRGRPGAVDVNSTLKGDGSAWGFNVGVQYQLHPRHVLALTYRQPYSITYDGDLAIAGQQQDITATVDFPAVVVLGYAFRPTDHWKLEFNLDWTAWRGVDDITIHFKQPGQPDLVQAQGLHNTVAFKVGTEYQCTPALALRGGYIYNQNATPEENWRPSLLDTDAHFLTAGLGYTFSRVTLDLALQFIFNRDRIINNNVDNNEATSSSSIDGTYSAFAPVLSLSATYHF